MLIDSNLSQFNTENDREEELVDPINDSCPITIFCKLIRLSILNVDAYMKFSSPIVIDCNMTKALKSKRVNELELQTLSVIDNDVEVSLRLFKYEQVENPEGIVGNVLF